MLCSCRRIRVDFVLFLLANNFVYNRVLETEITNVIHICIYGLCCKMLLWLHIYFAKAVSYVNSDLHYPRMRAIYIS